MDGPAKDFGQAFASLILNDIKIKDIRRVRSEPIIRTANIDTQMVRKKTTKSKLSEGSNANADADPVPCPTAFSPRVRPRDRHIYKGVRPLTRPDHPQTYGRKQARRALLEYHNHTDAPENSDKILRRSNDTLLIYDKFPKARVHLLVLPRWVPHRMYHPVDAMSDPEFLQMMRREVAECLPIAARELHEFMLSDLLRDGWPLQKALLVLAHRNLLEDFHVGTHAHPSQFELHVHIISRDMSHATYSGRHYQTFNTPFLVELNRYPLPLDDDRRNTGFQNSNIQKEDLECWRCDQAFGHVERDWKAMQAHLDNEEWPGWIREGEDRAYQNGKEQWRMYRSESDAQTDEDGEAQEDDEEAAGEEPAVTTSDEPLKDARARS